MWLFWNEGTFTLTSSVQDLPVILKLHNFQSLEKALNYFMELKFCKSDVYSCFPNFLQIAIFVIIIYIPYVLKIWFCNVLKGANHYVFYVLLKHVYSTVTTKHLSWNCFHFQQKSGMLSYT